MNEELLKQIVPIVEKTKEGILKAVEIAQEQMPDLIQQLYRWEFAISLLGFLLGVSLLILGFCWIKPINKFAKENDWDAPYFFGYGIPIFIGFAVASSMLTWLKIIVAPKLFLIEYISNLIK